MVQVRPRPFVSENILIMIGAKRSAIFPLRVADAVAMTDRDPSDLCKRNAPAGQSLPKPRDDHRRFGFKLSVRDIVIGQRAVKRILPRDEVYRDVVVARGGIGVVVAAVIARPIRVPRTFVIRHRIISGRHFANPKNGRDDVRLPRITRSRKARSGRNENLRLDFKQRLRRAASSHTWQNPRCFRRATAPGRNVR